MIPPAIPANEISRLRDLFETELLDTPSEKEFDDIVKLASQICGMPISLITLIDNNRQWFKAKHGLDADETPREISFCGHAILDDQVFEVKDTLTDARFFDNPLVTDDLKVRYYAGFPLITSSGNRLGTLCVVDTIPRELTEQQKFALEILSQNVIKIVELRIKNKQLNHMAETQKKMSSILAHDVRSPLIALRSIIEYKRSGMINEVESESLMDTALDQLNSTVEMVDDVVAWGESELKHLAINSQLVSIKEIIDNVFGNEAIKARLKNNVLINHVNGTQVYTDKQALTFIVRNLISNANKFTENGSISISASKKNGQVYISIKDTGCGMDADYASKLFTQHAVSKLGTRKEKGNGLGLILINEYIHKLEGTITVETEAGKGSCFTIRLNDH